MLSYIFLTFLLTQTAVLQAKKRVILFGVDGLNPLLIQNATSNGNISYLKENGAWTYKARTTIQTVSAPGWSTILCSLNPTSTGILTDNWLPPWNFSKTKITPITGNKSFPCIFEEIKVQNKDLRTCSYYDWLWFAFLGNAYMKNSEFPKGFIDKEVPLLAPNLNAVKKMDINATLQAIDTILNEDFDFLFLYQDLVDETGHAHAWGSPQYEAAVGLADKNLGLVIEALKKKEILNSTYILFTADHGGNPGDFVHGKQEDSNLFVPYILMGPNVKKNHTLEGNIHVADVSPTLLYSLGLKSNPLWRGRITFDAFINEEEHKISQIHKKIRKNKA